jgi:hypothetical protein
MTTALATETEATLRRFIAGRMAAPELEAWIITSLDEESDSVRPALWELRLLLTEVGEGIRPLSDAKKRVKSLLLKAA